MMMEKGVCETDQQNQGVARVMSLELDSPNGIRLEASEFERLLERAAEILSLRERIAA